MNLADLHDMLVRARAVSTAARLAMAATPAHAARDRAMVRRDRADARAAKLSQRVSALESALAAAVEALADAHAAADAHGAACRARQGDLEVTPAYRAWQAADNARWAILTAHGDAQRAAADADAARVGQAAD